MVYFIGEDLGIVKGLLSEQENKVNQKLLSKRLKNQRENYLLKSNQDLRQTDARVTLTSLQKVRDFDLCNSNNKFMGTGNYTQIIHK